MSWLALAAEVTPEVPQMGQLVGGWEYVWASYIVTWVGIVLYAASLFLRRQKA